MPPADTYFALAVADNSHNHAGARLLFLDFQDTPDVSAMRNNVVIAPRVPNGSIVLDGQIGDWSSGHFSQVSALVQNNYPLSEFVDAVRTDISVGAAWDDDYVYLAVQWEDAGHRASLQYRKWAFDGNAWSALANRGASAAAPNAQAANAAGHVLAGEESEDRVLVMFPIQDGEGNFAPGGLGCAAYCHANLRADNPFQNYTGTGMAVMHTNLVGDRADIWHWKAARTQPAGFADDEHLDHATGATDGRSADAGSAAYASNNLAGANPQFMHRSGLAYPGDTLSSADAVAFSGTPVLGTQIPATIAQAPSGGRADVETRAHYDGGRQRWTVEFRRRRDTGDNNDRAFVAGTNAPTPTSTAVASVNVSNGQALFQSRCQSCHGANGIGTVVGTSWGAPRIQRASGSLIRAALRRVTPMQGISLTEQEVEDAAAFLQTQASFLPTFPLAVTVTGVPAGTVGAVSSLPAGISCPGSCSFNFTQGATITLNANYVAGYSFTGWGGACSGTGTCDVTLNAAQTVSASYAPATQSFTLQVDVTGNGTVTSSPPGIDCGADCAEFYSQGARVTLAAVPGTGQQFDGWSGGGCTGSGACVVTLDADVTITAAFSPIAVPTCQNGGVVYDNGGTNGFGRRYLADTGIANFAPTDIAFVPGSTTAFVVTSQTGYLHYFNGACSPVNNLDLRSALPVGSSDGEQGLLNVEFHPDYTTNRYVFFYHTSVNNTVNSVSRMTVSFDAGGNLALSDRVRIIDFRKNGSASNHNGGGLVFAPDKTLLASVGDGGGSVGPNTAQDNRNLLGKVVRVSPNLTAGSSGYTIPAGNMFAATNDACTDVAQSAAACPEILAMGLRNPFRMSIDGNIVFLGDVGSNYEEINSFGYSNVVNFGWPTHDGPVGSSPLTGYRNPIVAYRRGVEADDFRAEDPMGTASGSASVMIGDVYHGLAYGGLLDGALLFGDFYDGFNRYVGVAPGPDGNGVVTDTDLVPGLHLVHEDGISSIVRGPDGFLYMTGLYGPAMVYRLVRP